MDKGELIGLLHQHHNAFIRDLANHTDQEFRFAPEGKWSAAQQLDHLIKSVAPVTLAMALPPFLLQWLFGVANRPSRSYEALVEKYHCKLGEGGRASGRFIPKESKTLPQKRLLRKLERLVDRLCKRTEKMDEQSLDTYLLPHPLLGKLTLREMLYFTAYHAEHHRLLVKKGLTGYH
ncbi:MAG: DinB family protein [Bacteroidota bacterium]|nr:DinB family protein [Bacteroidota bacterium]